MGVKEIAIISSVPLSEPVSRNRLVPFCNLFIEKGLSVSLICPKSDPNSHAHPAGVNLIEVSIESDKPKSFFKRAIKEASDAATLLKVAKAQKADAYLPSMPSMFLAFLPPFYLPKKCSFIDIRDLTWEYLSDKSFLQRLSKNAFRFLFKRTINFYQLVAVTNSVEFAYVNAVRKGVKPTLLVSNGITKEQFDKLQTTLPANNDKLTVTYIGNVGIAQNLETLVGAAKQLPEVQFRIIGAGIELDKVSYMVRESKLSNVELTGRIPWDSVKDYYNSTDVLYAQLTSDFAGAMPSKLYEYLSTGKYIIYGGEGQAAEKLGEFNNNQVIPPNDANALVEAIKAVKECGEINKLSKQNRQQIEEHYIRENTARKLIDGVIDTIN
ncbi:glycosyltransferase [Aliidiomarina taiwanensis]|nr:glycosyltransferase [Aliidiomarina taiwanensis]